MVEPGVLTLAGLCLAAAVWELDNAHVGQWMIARPMVAGPLLGALCGDMPTGARVGIVTELLIGSELPVGNILPLNGTVAVAAALLLSLGERRMDPAAALPAGLLAGSLHRRVEFAVRRWRSVLSKSAERALTEGRDVPFARIMAASLGGHALFTAAFLFVAVAGVGPLLGQGWAAAPEKVRRAFEWAYQAAPWAGAAVLLRAFWK